MGWLTDEAGHSFSTSGNAVQDIVTYKFGNGSLKIPTVNGSDYVYAPDSSDFTVGDNSFCVDFWSNSIAYGADVMRGVAGHYGSGTGTQQKWGIDFRENNISNTNAFRFRIINSANVTVLEHLNTATAMTIGTWYHIALCVEKSGSTFIFRWFKDGTQVGTDSQYPEVVTGTDSNPYTCILKHVSDTGDNKPITGTNWATYWTAGGSNPVTWANLKNYYAWPGMPDPNDNFRIGRWNADLANHRHYLDEFRFSVGTPRWTSNFTPPSSAYTLDGDTKILMHYDSAATKSSSMSIISSVVA